jgi:AcrR family transcriptional regulator
MSTAKTLPLTRERILDTTVEVLRRHGLEKTGVVDVARALGVSHGALYRHFASKAALIDAVAERWLAKVSHPLAAIAEGGRTPPARLRLWIETLVGLKRRKVLEDPALFAVYHAVAEAAHSVVRGHVEALRQQLASIVAAGVARGDFKVKDPASAAAAVFDATLRFHHPAFVAANAGAEADRAMTALLDLLLAGLKAGAL